MKLCEFCIHQNEAVQQKDGQCEVGHKAPPKMRCGEFTPSFERFFAKPADYRGTQQLKEMAVFFGLKGNELKRVLTLSERAQKQKADSSA